MRVLQVEIPGGRTLPKQQRIVWRRGVELDRLPIIQVMLQAAQPLREQELRNSRADRGVSTVVVVEVELQALQQMVGRVEMVIIAGILVAQEVVARMVGQLGRIRMEARRALGRLGELGLIVAGLVVLVGQVMLQRLQQLVQ